LHLPPIRNYHFCFQSVQTRLKDKKEKGEDGHDISIHRIIIYTKSALPIPEVKKTKKKKPRNNDHKNPIPQKIEHQNNPSPGHTAHSKLLSPPNTKRVPKVST